MSTKITIEIVAGDTGYTAQEANILDALRGAPVTPTTPTTAAPAPAAAPAKVTTKAPVKAAPSPKSAQSTTPAVLDTTLDEEPEEAEVEVEEAEDDLLGGGETYTKEDAIKRATALVSGQKQAAVKKALAAAGAKRVSDLNDDEGIAAFMKSLDDQEV
jgi:hypothetical protein